MATSTATATAAPAAPVTSPSPVTTKSSRPKTCAAFHAATGIGEAGCKRLPRHTGDHRVTLNAPKVVRVTKAAKVAKPKTAAKPRHMSAAKRKEALAAIAARMESGDLSAFDALAEASKLA